MLDTQLRGYVALVSGAGSESGIGMAIARRLGASGAKLIITASSNRIVDRVKELRREGFEVEGRPVDLTDEKLVREFSLWAESVWGRVDILVNNAGILLFKEIAEIQDDEFDRILTVNLKSVFYTLREAANRLADHGRVVNISSTVTRTMIPKYGAYAATKAGVEQLTRIFAREMGKRGITANAILPGPVDTELFRTGKTSADIERMAAMSALGRIGTAEDVAQVVLFLVSDEAAWVNGQMIGVNGGII